MLEFFRNSSSHYRRKEAQKILEEMGKASRADLPIEEIYQANRALVIARDLFGPHRRTRSETRQIITADLPFAHLCGDKNATKILQRLHDAGITNDIAGQIHPHLLF